MNLVTKCVKLFLKQSYFWSLLLWPIQEWQLILTFLGRGSLSQVSYFSCKRLCLVLHITTFVRRSITIIETQPNFIFLDALTNAKYLVFLQWLNKSMIIFSITPMKCSIKFKRVCTYGQLLHFTLYKYILLRTLGSP